MVRQNMATVNGLERVGSASPDNRKHDIAKQNFVGTGLFDGGNSED